VSLQYLDTEAERAPKEHAIEDGVVGLRRAGKQRTEEEAKRHEAQNVPQNVPKIFPAEIKLAPGWGKKGVVRNLIRFGNEKVLLTYPLVMDDISRALSKQVFGDREIRPSNVHCFAHGPITVILRNFFRCKFS